MPRTMEGNDAEVGSSRSKRSRQYETVEEVLLPQVDHEFLLWEGCNNEAKSSKKIIKFRLGGRAHNLTLLEFARRLGLYHADELEEDGFDVTTGYGKIPKNDLWLLSMFNARHQNGYANVAWLIARWIKRKGAGTQKENLDTTTLRKLIDSEGRLIPEDPQP
ncbi:hypothetical protein Tco_1426038, partial [Tanacetum coccineum]